MNIDRFELSAYIGRTGLLTGDTLPVRVSVTNAVWQYGRVILTVTNGESVAKVNAERVRLDNV